MIHILWRFVANSVFIIVLFFVFTGTAHADAVFGVNMSGGEYTWEQFPAASDFDYLRSKGVTLVRLPIAWEKFQPDLNGPLDPNETSGLLATLNLAAARGMSVVIDLQNFGRYSRGWVQAAGWSLNANGNISTSVSLPATDTYTFAVQARGAVAGGVWPTMELDIDGVSVGSATVSSASYTVYSFPVTVAAGTHTMAIALTNSGSGGQYPTLYVAKVNATGGVPSGNFSTVFEAQNMPTKTVGAAESNIYEGVAPSPQIIGTTYVPVSAYQDFWTKLATVVVGHAGVYGYDLMNEPHDMGGSSVWPTAAQAAVDAIRAVDHKTTIIVEGDGWAGANQWAIYNSNLNISDPDNNLIYEAHQYFDSWGDGSYPTDYANSYYSYTIGNWVTRTPTSGNDMVAPFLNWLSAHGYRGYLGEFGIPDNDPRWLVLMENVLKTMQTKNIPATYWKYTFHTPGDPSWWHYHDILGVDPANNNGKDEPQIGVLQKVFKGYGSLLIRLTGGRLYGIKAR